LEADTTDWKCTGVIGSECKTTDVFPGTSLRFHWRYKRQVVHKRALFLLVLVPPTHNLPLVALSSQLIESLAEMALTPILNSGWYTIRNIKYGAIRDDEGALGAKGNSKDPELRVSHRPTDTLSAYDLTL
jgi:hypothetical protein